MTAAKFARNADIESGATTSRTTTMQSNQQSHDGKSMKTIQRWTIDRLVNS
jgi:hypothetical protein